MADTLTLFPNQRLEDMIAEFVAGLMRTPVDLRRREENRKQQDAERQQRSQEATQLSKETQRTGEEKLKQLNRWVEDRERAERLRRLAAAYAERSCTRSAQDKSEYKALIEWASRQADRRDPFVSEKSGSVLGRKRELTWYSRFVSRLTISRIVPSHRGRTVCCER
jgi:hypothetical protein